MKQKMVNIDQIKKLRQETGISIAECKKALEEAKGDMEKAREILQKAGKVLAAKRKEKKAEEGIIESYIHANGRVGALVELHCESDFVARSPEFKELAHELAMQVAALPPEEGKDFLDEPWIRDSKKTIRDLIEEKAAKFGENIVLEKFIRYEL